MRTVKLNDGKKYTVYDTLKELLDLDLEFITEYDGYYYTKPSAMDEYDETVYKVNKETGKAVCVSYIDYICDIGDKAKSISIDELRRAS